MAKWEIVRGLATDWKQHKAWWVMSYHVQNPGGRFEKVVPYGPHLVRSFDSTDRLWISLPDDATYLFTSLAGAEAPENTALSIPHSSIWARMPAEVPVAPNVEMCFEQAPWLEKSDG